MEPKRKKKLAQHFRRNMTLPEVLLWQRIKGDQLGYRIRRQVEMGRFILDFYCAHPKLAIEVDGGDHAYRKKDDSERDKWLQLEGIRVVRFPALSVLKSPDAVAFQLKELLDQMSADEDTSLDREVGEERTGRVDSES